MQACGGVRGCHSLKKMPNSFIKYEMFHCVGRVYPLVYDPNRNAWAMTQAISELLMRNNFPNAHAALATNPGSVFVVITCPHLDKSGGITMAYFQDTRAFMEVIPDDIADMETLGIVLDTKEEYIIHRRRLEILASMRKAAEAHYPKKESLFYSCLDTP